MKYIIFTADGYGLAVAQHLVSEGCDVLVAQINDIHQCLTDKELENKPPKEKSQDQTMRLSFFEGIVTKLDADKVIQAMESLPDKNEFFLIFDSNVCFRYAEKALALGFKLGNFPTQSDRLLEVDRSLAKEFVSLNYPQLSIAEVQEFKTVEEALTFLEDTDKKWVLKSNGDAGETVCPSTGTDIEGAKREIIDTLTTQQKVFEMDGFILEEFIEDPLEITPEIIFWNGRPVYTSVDLELKCIGNQELGPQVGCGGNLIIRTELDDPINRMAFPQVVYEMARQHSGLFIMDASMLYSPQSNQFYFGEFCSNRFGYDTLFTEMDMTGSETPASSFFEHIARGENPLQRIFGLGIRFFNLERGKVPVTVPEPLQKHVWLYECIKLGDEIMTTGNAFDVGVVTASGYDYTKVADEVYASLGMVSLKKIYYRSRYDIESLHYPSLLMRYLVINEALFNAPCILLGPRDGTMLRIKDLNKTIAFNYGDVQNL